MKNANIRCWIKTHKRMKSRLASRIASLPGDRWIVKAAEWNPELKSKYKTNRAIGRQRSRWEDNEFLKLEETKFSTGCDNKFNHGSKQQKTEEDELHQKTITQRQQRKDLRTM